MRQRTWDALGEERREAGVSYQQLPMDQVKVEDLVLDLDNYRIPTRPDDEAAALNYLFAEEDVLDAATLILRDGYFDNEVPIVVEEDGAHVVLEGNRRVSALKALLDPDSVPSHTVEIRRLLTRFAVEAENLPLSIRVLVAPSREVARPHIARLHTGLSKKRWSRDQQANYYFSLLGPGVTVDDLKLDYPDVQVVRFLKMVAMRRFLSGVAFTDPSLHDYVISPALTMSAFEYAYRNADIAAAIGAVFDGEGRLVPHTLSPHSIGAALDDKQRAAVEQLMTQFRAKRLNTRSDEFKKGTPEHQSLLESLTGTAPTATSPAVSDARVGDPSEPALGEESPAVTGDPHQAGGTGAEDGLPKAEQPAQIASPRGPNHPNTKSLSLAGLDYGSGASHNLQLRYQELRKIDLKETPAAAAMLLRSVLETTIKFHFEGTSTPATGALDDSFKLVVTAYGKQKALQHSIARIRNGGTTAPGSVQWFNVASHSAELVVDAQQVRDAYSLLEPVLRRLLRPAADS